MHNFSRVLVIFGTVIAVLAVLTGGNASAGLSFPFITATQASYLPGDTPIILGYEFQPGQALVIKITRPDGSVVNASGGQGSDSIVVDSSGHFSYNYPPSEIIKGLYYVDAINSSGAVLASTVFEDSIATNLKLYGMPDVGPSARGVGGTNGLVDAIAGKCLVGTVDITARGNDHDVRGFFFDLVVDHRSTHQGPGNTNPLKDFINQLETVSRSGTIDHDTGGARDPDTLNPNAQYFTTSGNTPITTFPFSLTSLGTVFEVAEPTAGPDPGEVTYRVTVCGDGSDPDLCSGNPVAITDARFEYCARINTNAGDNDNGTDGFITSNPETGGTESSPINVVDTSPPVCVLRIVPCGIEVTASDPQSGIASIVETRRVNANTTYTPSHPPPLTFNDVIVTACKVNSAQPSTLALTITNGAGLITKCDPVDFQLVRNDGRPVRHNFPLEVGEGYLYINNDGLQQITMQLNGATLLFSTTAQGAGVYQIPEFGEVNYDLTDYLVPNQNSVEITAVGRRGGSARIVIHDLGN